MEATQNKKKKWNGKHQVPSRSSQHIFTKSYSDESVNRLKRLLQNHTRRGEKRFFAIKIDGEFCIYKTSDIRHFDDYKEFVDANTESVEVVLYFGRSNNCNRHIFFLKNIPLSGVNAPVDVDKKIEEALAQKDQEFLIRTLKKKVKKQAALIEEMEEELNELREKTDLRGILREGIALVGAFNQKSPTDATLSGTPKNEPEKVEVEIVEDKDQKEKSTEQSQEQLSEEQQKKKDLFEEMYDHLGSKGLDTMLNLMQTISQSEQFRNGVNQLIQQENERRAQQRSENSETNKNENNESNNN